LFLFVIQTLDQEGFFDSGYPTPHDVKWARPELFLWMPSCMQLWRAHCMDTIHSRTQECIKFIFYFTGELWWPLQ